MKAVKINHPTVNADLIALYHDIVTKKRLSVSFEWVRGHSGNKYNEECDKMARAEYLLASESTGVKQKKNDTER